MSFWATLQNVVYDSSGNKKNFITEDLDIEFTGSTIKFPAPAGAELAPAFLAMLPALADVGFQLTGRALENRVKKYSANYSKQKSYLEAGDGLIPDFSLNRKISFQGQEPPELEALNISFKAQQVPKLEGIIYYVNMINLVYSSAKVASTGTAFDYSIEIKPTLLINGEKKLLQLSPLVISSVKFKNNTFSIAKHRTEIIPTPPGAVLTDMAINVVETNPAKIRAEKILSLWTDNKDSAKTIINNFLPKGK